MFTRDTFSTKLFRRAKNKWTILYQINAAFKKELDVVTLVFQKSNLKTSDMTKGCLLYTSDAADDC